MTSEHKAINEVYSASINNTTRNTDSYEYAPREYSSIRSEQDEETVMKRRIALELNNMTKRASRGLKEDYYYILTNIKKLEREIAVAINRV